MAKVEFGGILKEACLAYTPEVQVGDYVIVHVGFAHQPRGRSRSPGDLLVLGANRSGSGGGELRVESRE